MLCLRISSIYFSFWQWYWTAFSLDFPPFTLLLWKQLKVAWVDEYNTVYESHPQPQIQLPAQLHHWCSRAGWEAVKHHRHEVPPRLLRAHTTHPVWAQPNVAWVSPQHNQLEWQLYFFILNSEHLTFNLFFVFFTMLGVWLYVRTLVASSPSLSTSCRRSILSSGLWVICLLTVHRSWQFPNPLVSSENSLLSLLVNPND